MTGRGSEPWVGHVAREADESYGPPGMGQNLLSTHFRESRPGVSRRATEEHTDAGYDVGGRGRWVS
jgi:hypothetical protein